jgi:hypothetical protein
MFLGSKCCGFGRRVEELCETERASSRAAEDAANMQGSRLLAGKKEEAEKRRSKEKRGEKEKKRRILVYEKCKRKRGESSPNLLFLSGLRC